MSTLFQNRLVGTIIVAAVVIIFLPDVLDGEKKVHQTDFEAIPNAPVFSGKLTSKPFPEEELRQKVAKPMIDEQAQDDFFDDGKAKVTPAIKNQSPDDANDLATSTRTKKVVSASTPSKNKETTNSLPEKAIAKQAWVIHLGSFKHKQNVAQLLAKLKANGYTAFTQPINTKQGILTKVFVGPELSKSSLDKKLIELKKLTNSAGKVARFYPNK